MARGAESVRSSLGTADSSKTRKQIIKGAVAAVRKMTEAVKHRSKEMVDSVKDRSKFTRRMSRI